MHHILSDWMLSLTTVDLDLLVVCVHHIGLSCSSLPMCLHHHWCAFILQTAKTHFQKASSFQRNVADKEFEIKPDWAAATSSQIQHVLLKIHTKGDKQQEHNSMCLHYVEKRTVNGTKRLTISFVVQWNDVWGVKHSNNMHSKWAFRYVPALLIVSWLSSVFIFLYCLFRVILGWNSLQFLKLLSSWVSL